ncbi:CD1247 N-terminal domain-containing protein [Alkaliphilus peptidifermentans]|uniref:MJ0042 family finger-like domain-containing protein n=1 Tax=Alkaliphilus peptidifermentans DSM 18978 TaxID=1120976 RepID=A0A1G5KEP3_9FIRM|nr:CD1247 N-terminal domain-containing protein [Alkaliphilus peptidifermentans]SCY98538.1 MJ0042 family finger-like domain-containing protein [Alkaliphilus peptidifermentans DSM 18978]
MEYLYEKVAYLKGLADGLDIKESSKEGKILLSIIDILEDYADAIVELGEEQDDLTEYVEALDEDLMDVEDELFEDDDYEDEDDDDDIDFAEVECPYCSEEIYVDEDLIDEDEIEVVCPKCHRTITVMEDDEMEHYHDGHCGHHHHEVEED